MDAAAETAENAQSEPEINKSRGRHATRFRWGIAIGTFFVITAGYALYARAKAHVNKVDLDSQPKPVTVTQVVASTYQAERHYVGTAEPWVQADIGPQLISAFVSTVLVRPGDNVKHGQVLATLDCRDASASNRAVAAQAQAISSKQKALASEAARVNSLLDGGFAAPNEAEQKLATSQSELAELMATQAKLAGTSLAVNDCVLRAPFDGEVSRRVIDPGAFVRPGMPLVSIVDRSTVRVTAEVPEGDFDVVAPGTPVKIHLLATGGETAGTIARRSPVANGSTRTVHFEIDLSDPGRQIPVGTTAELGIKVGKPEPASMIALSAASVRETSATVFIVEGNQAKKVVVPVKGESLGTLFVDTALKPGTTIVTEGRSLLADGDVVAAKKMAPAPQQALMAKGKAKP